MGERIRFAGLRARGVFSNRTSLANAIAGKGLRPGEQPFPPGKLTGPNSRSWDWDDEVVPWLAARPSAPKRTNNFPPKSPGRPPGPAREELRNLKRRVDYLLERVNRLEAKTAKRAESSSDSNAEIAI